MTVEHLPDHASSLLDTSAVGLEGSTTDLPAHAAGFEIIEGRNDLCDEGLRRCDSPSRTADLEDLDDLPDVRQMRSE